MSLSLLRDLSLLGLPELTFSCLPCQQGLPHLAVAAHAKEEQKDNRGVLCPFPSTARQCGLLHVHKALCPHGYIYSCFQLCMSIVYKTSEQRPPLCSSLSPPEGHDTSLATALPTPLHAPAFCHLRASSTSLSPQGSLCRLQLRSISSGLTQHALLGHFLHTMAANTKASQTGLLLSRNVTHHQSWQGERLLQSTTGGARCHVRPLCWVI